MERKERREREEQEKMVRWSQEGWRVDGVKENRGEERKSSRKKRVT